MSKYHAKKTVLNGVVFDSKAQAARYQELCLLERAGAIRNLRLEPRFELQPKFKRFDGRTERAIMYTADFAYTDDDGVECVEEVKSKGTRMARDYSLRRKLFMFKFPEYRFVETMA